MNVRYALSRHEVTGFFFFQEKTANSTYYLDMLEVFAVPQMAHLQPNAFLQQDGTPSHWGLTVRESVNKTFPSRWIGPNGSIPWSPRSPDINPIEFYLLGLCK
jgi:hypothetical protein